MSATAETRAAAGSSVASRSGATARVIEGLRYAIVHLEFEPGAKLDKADLTRRFGVSRFPIAEALNQLKAEGLVDIRPQSGSSVSRIRLVDARENMFLRRALEGEAVEYLARNRTAQFIEDLRANIQLQKIALDADDRTRFHSLDLELHDLFVSAIGYSRVRAVVESARLSLDRARRMLINPRRHVLSYREHVSIVEAVSAGSGSDARAALASHLDSVMEELEDFARKNPSLFS